MGKAKVVNCTPVSSTREARRDIPSQRLLTGGIRFGVMVLKDLTALELARIAAGPPRPNPNDLVGSRKERSQYDGLVRRQRKLAALTVEPPEPLRRSSRFEQKKLFVSDDWLQKEHPAIGRVEAGTPVASPRHVRRRIAATTITPGGSEHVEAEVVAYTNPQPEERLSERKRRSDRARR